MSTDQYPTPPRPQPPAPGRYERVAVRRDAEGGLIAVRRFEFLAPTPRNTVERVKARASLAARRLCGLEVGVALVRSLRGGAFGHFRLDGAPPDLEILDFIAELRALGIKAQPNHIYFVNTRASAAQFNPNTFAPNTFAPNTFAPNTFAPNTFAPNTFAPNTFAPNTFAPNTFAPNTFAAGWGAGACCDRCDEPEALELEVPKLAARPVRRPTRNGATDADNERIEIHIVDIASPGLANKADPTGEYDTSANQPTPDPAAVDENGDGFADPAVGHGDFIRSIIKLESGFDARLWQSADALGEISDGDLIKALEDVVASSRKDAGVARILNLSLSGYHTGVDPDELALRDQIAEMLADDWIIVAAAGNNADCRPTMPASQDGVIAVGAISVCGPAWFTNHGWWVDVSAPGVDVIAEYPVLAGGDLEQHGELRVGNGQDPSDWEKLTYLHLKHFSTGWARWSGTSFSTPFVVARIALALDEVDADPATQTLPLAERIDLALHRAIYRDDIPQFPGLGRLLA